MGGKNYLSSGPPNLTCSHPSLHWDEDDGVVLSWKIKKKKKRLLPTLLYLPTFCTFLVASSFLSVFLINFLLGGLMILKAKWTTKNSLSMRQVSDPFPGQKGWLPRNPTSHASFDQVGRLFL
jgi:hypothetical protein